MKNETEAERLRGERIDNELVDRLREATKRRMTARSALNALIYENEVNMTDRNSRLYAEIAAAIGGAK